MAMHVCEDHLHRYAWCYSGDHREVEAVHVVALVYVTTRSVNAQVRT